MGFIGGGTILRRPDLVTGVTTAATLWLATVIGLCFGAGEIGLGLIATAGGLSILWGFEFVERYIPQEKRATLVLTSTDDAPELSELVAQLQKADYAVTTHGLSFTENGKCREARFDVKWYGSSAETEPPPFLAEFARRDSVVALRWEPVVD
jgi:putative Mg2+ transporter-C (MgtC) family protein